MFRALGLISDKGLLDNIIRKAIESLYYNVKDIENDMFSIVEKACSGSNKTPDRMFYELGCSNQIRPCGMSHIEILITYSANPFTPYSDKKKIACFDIIKVNDSMKLSVCNKIKKCLESFSMEPIEGLLKLYEGSEFYEGFSSFDERLVFDYDF